MCLAVTGQAMSILCGSHTPRPLGARPIVLDGAALIDFGGLHD